MTDAPAEAPTPLVSYDDFAKLDLRVAKILAAERVQGADKLLRLDIDVGVEKRQLVAGIATHYDPAALVGKLIIVIANLQPRKLRGLESQGMLLAADDGTNIVLLQPSADIAPGSRVR